MGNVVNILANIIVGIIGVLHVYILVLEMFLWDKPKGLKAFGNTQAAATATKVLAANQGLYNGFLAAGLFWGLLTGGSEGFNIKLFFLVCVAIAGVYGGMTASKKIIYIQTVPAVIGIVLLFLSR